MKTMTPAKMESQITGISLIWITALLFAPSHSQGVPKIKNLDCVNDYDRQMVCFWEVVNRGANCSSDFQFKYTDFQKKTLYCPNLDNEYDGSFRIPNKCICNMTVEPIIISDKYHIEVESQGRSVDKAVINIYPSIKPKTPSNVRVVVDDSDNGDVQWDHNYGYSFIAKVLSFHIQFVSKEDNKMALEDVITQVEPHYLFYKRQLKRGCEYSVRVRMRVKENKKLWSEWSQYAVFRNDYDLTVMDYKWVLISASCIVIFMLSVSCYFCITRTKERWWNNIPNPAQSKLAESGMIQKNHNYMKPTEKSSAKTSCGNYLSKLVKAHKPKYVEFSQENLEKDYLNLMGTNIKIIFEPEKVDIERCVQLYPREDDNLQQTELPEDKEEEIHLMATDMSIGKMFCDILCDPSMTVGTLEQLQEDNTFGSFGSPILRDNSKSIERHLPLSIVSQESGYQSYDSDDSPGDSKSDGPNPLYFASLGQGDFLPYAPVSSIDESTCHIGKEDAFLTSGYNSFASALGEATSDVMEGDNIVFSLGTMFCKPNYHSSLQNPKSILYYNTRCFTSCNENDLQPTITPTFECRIETHPTSVSEEQGYQSFNQAVQQGDTSTSTTSLVFDFGYKPFESPTRFSTSSLDSIGGLSELDGDLVQMNEDPQQAGVVNGGTDLWKDTQSPGFSLTELNFFNRKYPFYSETIGDERKGLANQALNIHYAIKTLKEADETLALTFDIGNHLSNFANVQGRKMSSGLEFPTNAIAYPCSLDEAPITCDKLLDKNGLHTDKSFPMKFENMSYFGPLYHLRTEGYSHLLVQENKMDEEGNSYMKIALW